MTPVSDGRLGDTFATTGLDSSLREFECSYPLVPSPGRTERPETGPETSSKAVSFLVAASPHSSTSTASSTTGVRRRPTDRPRHPEDAARRPPTMPSRRRAGRFRDHRREHSRARRRRRVGRSPARDAKGQHKAEDGNRSRTASSDFLRRPRSAAWLGSSTDGRDLTFDHPDRVEVRPEAAAQPINCFGCQVLESDLNDVG